MNRTAYKALSSELRQSLFKGDFHFSGTVFLLKQHKGLEVVNLNAPKSVRLVDKSFMTKTSRKVLLAGARKMSPINLPG